MAADGGFSEIILPPGFSDDDLAMAFSKHHSQILRYVAAWGRWMQWTGQSWKADETVEVFDHARLIARVASGQCGGDAAAAKRIASAATVYNIERLARSDRRHAATVDQWDADEWLLNTPGGVVDLRTGKARAHDPDDYMTKITTVSPGGDCPLWLRFLDTVMQGDAGLIAFVQRMAGYCLTGSTREHALFFAYGTGANGKGVTINTLTRIMGSYACVAGMETFVASQGEKHPTDLAMLRGARLVTAQETEESRQWAEAKIKAMTGGDPITARFMRQDFFTYEPRFKLLIAGNHRPGLRSVDEAIRRRFNLVPFSVRIPPEQRDKDLPEKLKDEWPGILAWAIAGAVDWHRNGLQPPAAVIEATEEYLGAEDAVGNWLAECCLVHSTHHTSASQLFASWTAWAEQSGERPGSQKAFSQRLVSKNFEAKRLAGGKAGFVGISVKPRDDRFARRYNPDDQFE